ncbi:MAG: radical SAM protein [Ruminococcaceae bacterium]|nr:radical SAM protein [Oscillospiraceae bacterium]
MDAVYQNVINYDRARLESVVPLETPYSMFIDPSSLCNFRCVFCAMHGGKEPPPFKKQLMSFELFKKAVDDVKQFRNPLKKLRLSHYGEPLLNPHFPEMASYAKKAGIAEHIEVVTNGSLLNPELNKRIADSGIDRIRISVEALDSEGYRRVSGVKLDMDQYINNIRDLYERCDKCEIYCRTVDISVSTQEDRMRFFELFHDVCDKYYIDNVIPLWAGFDEINNVKDFSAAESEAGAHGQELQDVMICPVPFYTMTVHADGEVGLCCADWRRELKFGNICCDSLKNIWNSKKVRDFWLVQAEGKRDTIGVCRKCLNPVYDCLDNLDPYREQLVSRLKNANQTKL